MRTLRFVLWGAAAAALLLGVWSGTRIIGLGGSGGATLSINGHALPEPRPVAAFELNDHLGRPFNLASLQGRWTLVYFGYTFCPDVCPTTLQTVGQTQRALADSEAAADLAYVFVSVDPERDTLERLAQYAPHFSPEMLGVTGSHPQLLTLSRPLGVIYAKVEGSDAENYLVDHSASLFLINPAAQLHAVFTSPHQASEIADDLLRLRESYRG
jgi:protein SCO1/2